MVLPSCLASDACTVSGSILVAGGGRFRKVETVETVSLDAPDGFADMVERLETAPREAHPNSNHAFDTLLVECGLEPRAPI